MTLHGDKAKERIMDLIAGRPDAPDPLSAPPLDNDVSADVQRWPLMARIAFITAAAAALWMLIHLAARPA